MARYLIISSDNEDKKIKEVLEQMGAEDAMRGMRGGSSGMRGGYRRDSRGYPMDVTNLRSGMRGFHDNQQEIDALEDQIQELKMRKRQLEHGEEGMRSEAGAYGPYPQ
jgi:hypothetical protein